MRRLFFWLMKLLVRLEKKSLVTKVQNDHFCNTYFFKRKTYINITQTNLTLEEHQCFQCLLSAKNNETNRKYRGV